MPYCGFKVFNKTGYSIFYATHPSMLARLDFDSSQAKTIEMISTVALAVKKTKDSLKVITNWVDCACEKECFAPKDASLHCTKTASLMIEHGNCHRFDQSALSILLSKCGTTSYRETDLIKIEGESYEFLNAQRK